MKIVVLYSGGLDSTVLLYYLMNKGHEVTCLGIDYGQRHNKELKSASIITSMLDVEYMRPNVSATSWIFSKSSLVDKNKPVNSDTVVPNRNMFLLSLATATAIQLGCPAVAYAAHASDFHTYYDCRIPFVDAMREAIRLCDESEIKLLTPFIAFHKNDIVRIGSSLGVPMNLTWSCYKGDEKHCGKCPTCIERKAAFKLAKVKDETEYE